MSSHSIKLYMAPGTCARVTMTALEEIGCDYETQIIAFKAGDHAKPDYLALNPLGAVPTLVVDDIPLFQTSAILKFLDETFPEAKLLPATSTPIERWEQNALFSWLSADVHPKLTPMRFPFIFVDMPEAFDSLGEKAAENLKRKMAWMDTRLSQQPWVLGDDWSILDAYLSWAWSRAVGSQLPAETFPSVEALSKRHAERPSAQRVLAKDAEAAAELEAKGLSMAAKP